MADRDYDDDDVVCHTDLCSHQRVTVEALEWALGKFRGDMRLVSLPTYAKALRDVLDEYQEADRG